MPKVDSILATIFGRNTVTADNKRALHSLSVQINREKSVQIDGERSAQINGGKSVHVNGEEAVPINGEESVQINRDKSEDDVKSTIEVLNKLHEEDEGFANVVDLDCYGKIKTMMWTNGKSRNDYRCFGDAVTFDTTYKTDMYNTPFGLFIGTNNHFQSVIFADQCRAMEVALANKLPQVTHRWCKWHVFRTIKVELGLKYTKEFKEGLNKQASTERSESAKHVLKGYIPLGTPMHVFVEQHHKLLRDWNEKEDAKVHEDRMVRSRVVPLRVWAVGAYGDALLSYYTGTLVPGCFAGNDAADGEENSGEAPDCLVVTRRKKGPTPAITYHRTGRRLSAFLAIFQECIAKQKGQRTS
ncbi:hypothetical protein U9M48_041413 [Paspalum notatum var. saurae]|uniref:Protein FAR1-RELATED SEQUENCE n=1 Tax=Paspalum notatum var. saurae TaxID=547442 RepID=A0AAQ3UUF6_PASNO